MPKTFYNCPLCQKQSAYISEYGMQDSVICKCQGLNEVGRLVNGKYQPNLIQKQQANPEIEPFVDISLVAKPSAQPNLPKGQGSGAKQFSAQSIGIQTANFMIYHLTTDEEIKAAGLYFNNALQSKDQRDSYTKIGDIYYAEHSDESRSIMFYISKSSKKAQNFVLRNGAVQLNKSAPDVDVNELKAALRIHNLITN